MIKRKVSHHPDLAKSFVWKLPARSVGGPVPPPTHQPSGGERGTFPFLRHRGHGTSMRRESRVVRARRVSWLRQVARGEVLDSIPSLLAEPLRSVLCARRAPLRAGAETSGAGCAARRAREPRTRGRPGPIPPLGSRGDTAALSPSPPPPPPAAPPARPEQRPRRRSR